MKIPGLQILICLALGLAACNGGDPPPEEEEEAVEPKSEVDTTSVTFRDMRQEERFTATAFYFESNKLSAPIAGFITRSPQMVGEEVARGQVLFTMETKEHRAINSDPELSQTDLAKMGVITVKAPASGTITSLNQREGTFVSEGTELATIVLHSKIGFRLSVPYQFRQFVKTGTRCTLEFPDSTRVPAFVADMLKTTANTSQTLTFLVKPLKPVVVNEGLNVEVIVPTAMAQHAAVLPKSAILSNETLDEFWVMKLMNDSTAVKIPVTLGLTTRDSTQIKSPSFSPEDKILTEGNYGLEDTALVQLKKPMVENRKGEASNSGPTNNE